MAFTSDVLVGRTEAGQRQTVKEQGKLNPCPNVVRWRSLFHCMQITGATCMSDPTTCHV